MLQEETKTVLVGLYNKIVNIENEMVSTKKVRKIWNKILYFIIPFVIALFVGLVKMSYDNNTNIQVIKSNMKNHIDNNEKDFEYVKTKLDNMKTHDCLVNVDSMGGNNG